MCILFLVFQNLSDFHILLMLFPLSFIDSSLDLIINEGFPITEKSIQSTYSSNLMVFFTSGFLLEERERLNGKIQPLICLYMTKETSQIFQSFQIIFSFLHIVIYCLQITGLPCQNLFGQFILEQLNSKQTNKQTNLKICS